ncbi:hypothetical protein HIM_06618 [Hirsutella minnesotensis 3608]|uniref:ABC-type Fe3+ transport system n=1 Tax=Hirsutella minnesotensis 3608 TaxID=1043627 RepID=A0A0F7ZNL3_9HYPO|nr:hypothetical protein HIM_06618 [Hirsutella minnesotensis 3608]
MLFPLVAALFLGQVTSAQCQSVRNGTATAPSGTAPSGTAPSGTAPSGTGSVPGTNGGTVETRTLEEIYQAALKEGGTITVWHGGDEKDQAKDLKDAFEAKFKGLTLNLTVDLSKYHDGRIDDQLAADNVYVDSVILQSLHDYPRWAAQGALLNYAPLGFDQIYPEFKDPGAAYYGLELFSWMNIWNNQKLQGSNFSTFQEFADPKYKDKLVLTWPNDDDAVMFAFELVVKKLGKGWLDSLLANNPRWVRGSATPLTLLMTPDTPVAASFTTTGGLVPINGTAFTFPTDADFVSWPQTGAILKKAPHPEGAKLLHSWMLTPEFQQTIGWSVRKDVPAPAGFPDIMNMPNTNASAFGAWMKDRSEVERLRFWYEDLLGTAQGASPLTDDL